VLVPVILPFFTAVLLLLVRGRPLLRRMVLTLSSVAQVVVAAVVLRMCFAEGVVSHALGGWGPLVGIMVVADVGSALLLLSGVLLTCVCVLYSLADSAAGSEHPLRGVLLQFLLVGVNLSFFAGDLFNLFVAFEVLLLSSYALMSLEADDWDIRQSYPFLALNAVGSAFFLAACGFVYACYGTLNMALLSERMASAGGDGRAGVLAALVLTVFAIKAGAFPLYFWLPNSYPTLPAPVLGVFGGLLTKLGVYLLMRFVGNVFPHGLEAHCVVLMWVGAVTMVLGVLGAVSRGGVQSILSYHILSQIGYMILAVGFFTQQAFAACLFFVLHNIFVKSCLLLTGGVVLKLNGTDELKKAGGLWKAAPVVGVVFFLQAMSLAGLPPLSGFWGKYMIVLEGLRLGEWVLAAVALGVSILTLFSMLKIWLAAYWKDEVSGYEPDLQKRGWRGMTAACAVLVVVSLFMGLFAQPVLQACDRAAEQIMDASGYREAVLTGWDRRGL
jgi:multicomponent Na+:H+ antiporter subunit D